MKNVTCKLLQVPFVKAAAWSKTWWIRTFSESCCTLAPCELVEILQHSSELSDTLKSSAMAALSILTAFRGKATIFLLSSSRAFRQLQHFITFTPPIELPFRLAQPVTLRLSSRLAGSTILLLIRPNNEPSGLVGRSRYTKDRVGDSLT